jgi:uncharacterized protein YgiM (DUF1202 family)
MMPKKVLLGLLTLVLLALAGCANTEVTSEKLVPLSQADWPAPTPTPPPVQPSPFPRMTLPVAAARATATPAPGLAGMAEVKTNRAPEVVDPPAATITGTVQATTLNLRQGPGTTYAVVTELRQGDRFTVQAANPARDWVQVTAQGKRGWLALAYVTLKGNVGDVPQAVTTSGQ